MEIVINANDNEELLKGRFQFVEGTSRQENRPAFFISTDNFEINILADSVIEVENLIYELQKIKNNFMR